METNTNNMEARLAAAQQRKASAELSLARVQLLRQLLGQDPSSLTDEEKRALIMQLTAPSTPTASAPTGQLVIAEGPPGAFVVQLLRDGQSFRLDLPELLRLQAAVVFLLSGKAQEVGQALRVELEAA